MKRCILIRLLHSILAPNEVSDNIENAVKELVSKIIYDIIMLLTSFLHCKVQDVFAKQREVTKRSLSCN